MQKERLIKAHNTLCGLIPSLFMRETNVVRLTSIRAAAPSGPATRPFVIFRKRTISSRSFASRVPAIGVCPAIVAQFRNREPAMLSRA